MFSNVIENRRRTWNNYYIEFNVLLEVIQSYLDNFYTLLCIIWSNPTTEEDFHIKRCTFSTSDWNMFFTVFRNVSYSSRQPLSSLNVSLFKMDLFWAYDPRDLQVLIKNPGKLKAVISDTRNYFGYSRMSFI